MMKWIFVASLALFVLISTLFFSQLFEVEADFSSLVQQIEHNFTSFVIAPQLVEKLREIIEEAKHPLLQTPNGKAILTALQNWQHCYEQSLVTQNSSPDCLSTFSVPNSYQKENNPTTPPNSSSLLSSPSPNHTIAPPPTLISDRLVWLDYLSQLVLPVLTHAANATLSSPHFPTRTSQFEAICRCIYGMAGWLELDLANSNTNAREVVLQSQFRTLAIESLILMPTDANSYQQIVEHAYLCLAFFQAPRFLWNALPVVRRNTLLDIMVQQREKYYRIPQNNWYLFVSTIDRFLLHQGRIHWNSSWADYGVEQLANMYVGGSFYRDGMFSMDYYNSIVIHPFLLEALRPPRSASIPPALPLQVLHPPPTRITKVSLTYREEISRAQKFARRLERFISPEATFPIMGRSLTYRFGGFLHHLGYMAMMNLLPRHLPNGMVRYAMQSVMTKFYSTPGALFDAELGCLKIGFMGHQPYLAERYISNGSVYAAAFAFLPLGLPPSHAFWKDAPRNWTSREVYFGNPIAMDHHRLLL